MNGHKCPDLHFSTDDLQVDEIIRGIIGLCEAEFPRRIKGYYLTGSYRYKEPVPSSDIDLIVIFRESDQAESIDHREDFGLFMFRTSSLNEEEQKFRDIVRYLNCISPIEISMDFRTEKNMARTFTPDTKGSFAFLYGEDILSQLASSPQSDNTFKLRQLMHVAYKSVCTTHKTSKELIVPLNFPEPDDEFYGYAKEKVDSFGRPTDSMKPLFTCIVNPSSALIYHKTGQHINGKNEITRLYKAGINDKWTYLISDAFTICRENWQYLIPKESGDRSRLRDLCQQLLGYCNHFLEVYRKFIIEQLSGNDRDGVLMAAMTMQIMLFKDSEIEVALKKNQGSPDREIRETIDQIF